MTDPSQTTQTSKLKISKLNKILWLSALLAAIVLICSFPKQFGCALGVLIFVGPALSALFGGRPVKETHSHTITTKRG